MVGSADDLPPTVRVTVSGPKPKPTAAKTTVKPFRFVNQVQKRRTPLHVPLRKKSQKPPLGKILIGAIVLLGLALFVGLNKLAVSHSERSTVLAPNNVQAPVSVAPKQIEESSLTPQGGPMEESFTDPEPEVEPKVVVHSLVKKNDNPMKLPPIDRLTSGYGVRVDPIEEKLAFHRGIDFKAEYRAEVKAALDGQVLFAKEHGSYGKLVILRHGDGYETRYAHLSKVLVSEGSKVRKGDLIGLAGSTGRSTGTHIHFELLKDGKRIDPLRVELISKTAS
jgi:murein DD-endopeptidase MepM/ murein hydrolase activator NlpD